MRRVHILTSLGVWCVAALLGGCDDDPVAPGDEALPAAITDLAIQAVKNSLCL